MLNSKENYLVSVSATDGVFRGNVSIMYFTDPDVSMEFIVQPSTGTSLSTNFVF